MGKTLALILFYTPSLLSSVYIIYLRMYIDRKGWDIPEINISLNFYQESDPELTTTISRSIRFPTEIEDDIKSDY
jgi:putative redox protein